MVGLVLAVIASVIMLSVCGWRLDTLKTELTEAKDKYKKLLSQKKSSEVTTGHIAEQCAPFLEQFPFDPKQSKFIGMPIDYLVFEDGRVVFVEVKSGNATLSKKQRAIRDNVKAGRVEWAEVRIK